MSESKKIFIAWLLPICWALLIYFLSSQSSLPSMQESALNFISKKMAHIIVYLVLYVLVHRATLLTFSQKKRHPLVVLLPVLICFIYAMSDELHQSFVPGRGGTIRDVGYDMLGVSIAFLKTHKYV